MIFESIDASCCRLALCELKFECILYRDKQTLHLHKQVKKESYTKSSLIFPLNVNTPLNCFDEFDMKKVLKRLYLKCSTLSFCLFVLML